MSNEKQIVQKIYYAPESQTKLLQGIRTVAQSVASTLGPGGRTVAYRNKFGEASVTKDGVTVARMIKPADPVEALGADLVREVAISAEDTSGDGTTTATILTHSIIENALTCMRLGLSPVEFRAGMLAAKESVQERFSQYVMPITDENSQEYIRNIVTVSSNNDSEIIENIVSAYDSVGRNGLVSVEASDAQTTSLSVVTGMSFDKGFESQYFINDAKNHRVEYVDPHILLLDGPLRSSHLEALAGLLGPIVQRGESLLIIAEKFDEVVVASILSKRMELAKSGHPFNVCLVRAPGFGDRRLENLEDIASFTGAHVVSEKMNQSLATATEKVLGRLSSVVIKHDTTTLVGLDTDAIKQAIDDRIEYLQGVINAANTEFDEARYLERIARLRGGIAVIRVGSNLNGETRELKERYEDALGAVKSALSEGVVVGGGVTLYEIFNDTVIPTGDQAFVAGFKCVIDALVQPIKTLIENRVGYDLKGIHVGRVLAELDLSNSNADCTQMYGYNAATNTISDLAKDGIFDPAKVIRTSLNFAVSTCILVLNTDTVLVDEKV